MPAKKKPKRPSLAAHLVPVVPAKNTNDAAVQGRLITCARVANRRKAARATGPRGRIVKREADESRKPVLSVGSLRHSQLGAGIPSRHHRPGYRPIRRRHI